MKSESAENNSNLYPTFRLFLVVLGYVILLFQKSKQKMSKFTFRLSLVFTLIMSCWLAVSSQTVFNISGHVQDEDQVPQENVEIWITGISALDSAIYFTTTFTNANGDYATSLTFAEQQAVGGLTVSMVDCFGIIQSQNFVVSHVEPDITADFVYCAGINVDSCVTFIIEEQTPGTLAELTVWTLPGVEVEYEWSTGETGSSIFVDSAATYCVTVTYPWGCVADACVDYSQDTTGFCFSYIISSPAGNGLFDLEAVSQGAYPFSYVWPATGSTDSVLLGVGPGSYCVVVTDAEGCIYTACIIVDNVNFCEAWIYEGFEGELIASPVGVDPFTFEWSTGETTQTIIAQQAGLYCVTITDATGCETSTCYQYWQPVDSCYVFINAFANEENELVLEAYGDAWPNTYTLEWSTGETSSSIIVTNYSQEYCVTLTSANGCVSTDCFDLNDFCYGWVNTVYLNSDTALLQAITDPILSLPGMPPITYVWDNGSTDSDVVVTENGTYCVTISTGNCVVESCTYVDFDSLANACVVYAYQYLDPATNQWVAQAEAFGFGEFEYLWSTGDTTSSILLPIGEFACVTVTSTFGCEASACIDTLFNPCTPWVAVEYTAADQALLTAYSPVDSSQVGVYLWSTGDTTASILVTEEGTYCVTVEAGGCVGETCVDVFFNTPKDTCGVWVNTEFVQNVYVYTAYAFGEDPLAFSWSTGETSPVIISNEQINDLCVTVTDNTGCIAVDCADPMVDSCSLYLWNNPVGNYIFAHSDQQIVSIVWSTGDTTNWIDYSEPGTYCATATTIFGCTAFACITIDSVSNGLQNSINGYVYTDSISVPQGYVFAWKADEATGNYNLIDSVQIDTNGFYFFSQLANGVYLVKAELTENSPGYGQYLPTYHLSSPFWEIADPIVLPNWLPVTNDIWMIPGQPLQGPGGIGGAVVDPAGILAEEHFDSRNVEGIGGIVVILRNANGDILQHRITDENGLYHFDNLPLGTYQVSYDITGYTSPVIWVTLTAEESDVNNVVLPVSLTTGNEEVVVSELTLYPNPGTDFVQIPVPYTDGTVQIAFADLQGRMVYNQKTTVSTNGIRADVADLAPGLYQVIVTTSEKQYIGRWVKQTR